MPTAYVTSLLDLLAVQSTTKTLMGDRMWQDRTLNFAMERATGIEPVLPTWEADPGNHCLQHLHNCLGKTHVHTAHAVL